MNNLARNVAFLFVILVIPLHGKAWGVLGHRIIGQIAENYLTSKTKSEIRKILGNESVSMSANWMDFIKSDRSFGYLGKWHYVNFAQGLTFSQLSTFLKKDTSTNIYTKINFVTRELKRKDISLEKKQMYLRILIHLVGDVHQPLHCGRAEDSGGNDIKVKWFNKQLDLHSLWDSELIGFQKLSYTEYANSINHPDDAKLGAWQRDDLCKWIFESYQLSDIIYKEAELNSRYSYKYNFDHVNTLNGQLLKGGVRLAGVLNGIFTN